MTDEEDLCLLHQTVVMLTNWSRPKLIHNFGGLEMVLLFGGHDEVFVVSLSSG
jgi:hypothetical protein